MNDFIAKPFQDEELIQKCLSWMPSSCPVQSADTSKQTSTTEPESAPPNSLKKYPPEFVNSIMEIFLETAPPVFQRLVTSVENSDWEGARTSAHWLRGGASRLIAPELQDQLTKVETACSTETPQISNAEIDSLARAFGTACDIAEKWRVEHHTYSTS
jgi:HPt (histidine-containing phosphotransfer) domain-containing protein